MTELSISRAAGTGFGLVRRRPGAVAAWGLVYFLLAILPQFLVLALVFPDLGSIAEGSGPDRDSAQMLALQSKVSLAQWVSIIPSIAAQAVVSCAVLRAVLEPEAAANAYLRLGDQELWTGVVILALGFFALMAMLAAVVPAAIVAGVAALAGGGVTAMGGLAALVIVAVAMTAVLYGVVRLSMALPMTFVERRFLLFESWAVTRGHGWPLFWLASLLMAVVLLIQVAVFGCALIAVVGVGFAFRDQLGPLFAGPSAAWLSVVAPVVLVAAAAFSLVAVALFTVMLAPWADVYRQLHPASGEAP